MYIDVGPGFVSMSPARIRRILSKQAGVVRSIIEKEKRGFVYILNVYIRVLAGIGRKSSPASIPVRRPNCCEDRPSCCCRLPVLLLKCQRSIIAPNNYWYLLAVKGLRVVVYKHNLQNIIKFVDLK